MLAQRTDWCRINKEPFAALKGGFAACQPPRLRPSKESEHFLDGAATPPCKGGEYASFAWPSFCARFSWVRPRCPADELWVTTRPLGRGYTLSALPGLVARITWKKEEYLRRIKNSNATLVSPQMGWLTSRYRPPPLRRNLR